MRIKLTPEQWEPVIKFDRPGRYKISVTKSIELMVICKEHGICSDRAYFIRASGVGRGARPCRNPPYGYLHGKPVESGRVRDRVAITETCYGAERVKGDRDEQTKALCRKYGFRPSRSVIDKGFIYGERAAV